MKVNKTTCVLIAILAILSVINLSLYIYTRLDQKSLRNEIRAHSELPESFGGVGYISRIDGNTISVVGYGKFLVSNAELTSLKVGGECPQYILKRGN